LPHIPPCTIMTITQRQWSASYNTSTMQQKQTHQSTMAVTHQESTTLGSSSNSNNSHHTPMSTCRMLHPE
jgi:hypothetical protein